MAAAAQARRPAVSTWQPGRTQAELLRRYAHVYELLWTGEVGSGKTEPGIMAPVLFKGYRDSPEFKGLVLRHQDGDLNKEIVQRILRPHMYSAYDAGKFNRNTKIWTMAAGGLVIFTHANDLAAHHGNEYQYVWWDELASFDEETYCTLIGRCRSAAGLPIRFWSGTNPWGPGVHWIKRRWGPWLDRGYAAPRPDAHPDVLRGSASLGRLPRFDQTGRPLPPVPFGEVLWYSYDSEGREIWVPEGTPDALSRCCLFTRTEDNERLLANDPLYKTRLKAVGQVNYRRLGQADWDAEEADEGFFQRAWFEILPVMPVRGVRWIRRWDFAWTKKRKSDYSVGVKMGTDGRGRYFIGDVVRMKGTPAEVEAVVKQTAQLDGQSVRIVLPIDFAAGIYVEHNFIRLLAGFMVEGVREKGEKEVRIATLQPQARVGNVALCAGAWNHTFLEEAAYYPKVQHDDQLDAAAGAFLYFVENAAPPTDEQLEQVGTYVRQQLGRLDHQEGFAVMDGSSPFTLE